MNEANKDSIEALSDNDQHVSPVNTNDLNININSKMQSNSKDEAFTSELNKYLELLNGSTASYVLGYN